MLVGLAGFAGPLAVVLTLNRPDQRAWRWVWAWAAVVVPVLTTIVAINAGGPLIRLAPLHIPLSAAVSAPRWLQRPVGSGRARSRYRPVASPAPSPPDPAGSPNRSEITESSANRGIGLR